MRGRAWRGLRVALAAGLLLAGPAHAGDGTGAALDRIEPLAGREPANAQRELDALVAGAPVLDEGERLRVEFVRALIADAQYRAPEALRIAAGLLEPLQRRGDARTLARVEHLRASAYYALGQVPQEWEALQEELTLAERSHDEDLIAVALVNRVRYFLNDSNYQSAAAALGDAAAHARGEAAHAELAYAEVLLAQNLDDGAAALRAASEARQRFERLGDRAGVADALAAQGRALDALGRPAEALAPLLEAGRIYRAIDDPEGAATSLVSLAHAQAAQNENDAALATGREAIEELAHFEEPWKLAGARVEQAGRLLRARRPAEALALLQVARAVVLEQADSGAQARLHDVTAQALAALGRVAAAYDELRLSQEAGRKRTAQLVARQLAAQRGRLESERLVRENALLRDQAHSSQVALAEVERAERLQRVALALGATMVLGALFAAWRQRILTLRFARLAQVDALTGTLNRRNLLESGQRVMNRCRVDGQPCALLMLDVDRFKDINDRHGHVAGDRALSAVAGALRQCLRPQDLIGRYGGEEFAVILPGADATEAGQVAERLRGAVQSLAPAWAPGAGSLTVSGGIAVAGHDTADLHALLLRADRALYRAKDAGRNRMEFDSLVTA